MSLKTINLVFLFITLIVCCSGCKRDDLYYEATDKVAVNFHVDWSATALSELNGVSLFLFNHSNGALYSQMPYFSADPENIRVMLPPGEYDAIIMNNTVDEMKNLEFGRIDQFSTIQTVMKTSSFSRFRSFRTRADELYSQDISPLAGAVIRNVVVTPKDVTYYREEPDNYERVIDKQIEVQPYDVTQRLALELHCENLTSIAEIPKVRLHGIPVGYVWTTDSYLSETTTNELTLENIQMDNGSRSDGVVGTQFYLFGRGRETAAILESQHLTLQITLRNGEVREYDFPLKGRVSYTENKAQINLKIDVDVELPLVVGEEGNGAFTPNVDEWQQIDVPLG